MTDTDFEYIVIGTGLFGSAATRHLSSASKFVAAVGATEPADYSKHDGVFASHWDGARLTRRIARDPIWADVANHAMDRYRRLEDDSGIEFYNPVGTMYIGSHDRDSAKFEAFMAIADELDFAHKMYEPGDERWRDLYPWLDFPSSYWLMDEPNPAGYIKPRKMVQAQLASAKQREAQIFGDTVLSVKEELGKVIVETADSGRFVANKALIAAGAFTAFNNLLPRKIDISIETETYILGQVSAETAKDLAKLPCLIYDIEDSEIDDIYVTPAFEFADGNYYIKLGCNSLSDQFPTTFADVQAWFKGGDCEAHRGAYERALQRLFPEIEFLNFIMKPCILSRTPNGYPVVDQLSDLIYVAAGGNGSGAKGSDVWGGLAAGLMHDGRWYDGVPRDTTRAVLL